MAHILVIGGVSSDTLYLGGRKHESLGGTGMYTAMAAQRSGIKVSMFSPRPDPLPEYLKPIARHLETWFGPVVSADELPRFEISYLDGKTEYIEVDVSAEKRLPTSMLPGDLSKYDLIHLTAVGDAENQLSFLKVCQERGSKRISVSTGLFNVQSQPEIVRAVFEQSDYCFLNVQEARAIYGSLDTTRTLPGKLLFITSGENGVHVIQGNHVTELPAVQGKVFDPTGAGDTFCGATNAHLVMGQHPVIAAQKGTALAAEMIQYLGPEALFRPDQPPGVPKDSRAVVDQDQVQRIATLIAALPEVTDFNFTGLGFPPVGHPVVLEWFFAATLQQFGFWTEEKGKYQRPMIAPINGRMYKGSDYLWQAYMRYLELDPAFFSPLRQADLTKEEMLTLFRADDGTDPMPALDLHLTQARQYGRDMLSLGLTPKKILQQANNSAKPLKSLFQILDHIGGYKEDPLRKKSGLLAIILNQRPEKLITIGQDEALSPVIDYHVMRTCLRTGLVKILDQQLNDDLEKRKLLQPAEEQAVRNAAYEAFEQVVAASGRSLGAVDWFFFNSRKRCPEMTEPDCRKCQIDPVCAHDKELFQPVRRTTNY